MPLPNSTDSRLQEAKQLMYRTHILDVAEEVFAELGFAGTQVKVVAARAKISLSTLYGHFENKNALYSGLHARRLQELMARLGTVGEVHAEPLEQMLAAIEGYVLFHMEHPTYLKMHLREGNAWSEAAGMQSPEQLETWRRGVVRMAGTFKVGMKSGVFVHDDPTLAARTTNALHQAALSHWVEDGMRVKPKRFLHRIHAQFIRAFCVPDKVVELLRQRGLDSK